MDVNVKLDIPALDKLLDVTCSGVGAVAGPMLAPWKAQQESKAQLIAAKGYAESLQIRIEAHSRARESLTSQDLTIVGELDIANSVKQRIQFQERKRQLNIEAVVNKAAWQLGDDLVADSEPDHDWTARFFTEVQDVCTASGFLDSGLTVFASTRPRPARRGRVAPARGFGSRTSPASSARCTSA